MFFIRDVSRRRTVCKRIAAVLFAVAAAGPGDGLAQEDLISTLARTSIVELNFVWDTRSPLLPFNPPFSAVLSNTHVQTDGWIPGLSFATDMMISSGQHGAPTIDAIGHIGHDGCLFGGRRTAKSESPAGLGAPGIEAYPAEKFVNRAVLLDVARHLGVEALAPGQEITAEQLEQTAMADGVQIRRGDSVLIRTGFGRYFEDADMYTGPRPGPGGEAAIWLANPGVFLVGDDQLSFEVYPKEGTSFPAHRTLIFEHGIYIVENLNLERLAVVLAKRGDHHFTLVVNPLRLRGMTGSPLNAFAIID